MDNISKYEKESALRDSLRVSDLEKFLKMKGFSLDEVEKSIQMENKGFVINIPFWDEFGLPSRKRFFSEGTSGVKNSKGVECNNSDGDEVLLDDFPSLPRKQTADNVKDCMGGLDNDGGVKKNWSSVLKSPPPVVNNVNFEFCPPPPGMNIVDPPVKILQKGLDKFKFCMIGVFTKGPLSFTSLNNSAHRLWGSKGLLSVFQKSETTFVFKFASLAEKSDALARGTCYFKGKPLVLSDWGASAEEKVVTSLPIWVKFSNVPECYWTSEGLSRIASVIGKPLSADALTSQLDLLPFTKMCIEYTVGNDLPSKIPVMALDLKGNKTMVEVLVEYVQKPLVCS